MRRRVESSTAAVVSPLRPTAVLLVTALAASLAVWAGREDRLTDVFASLPWAAVAGLLAVAGLAALHYLLAALALRAASGRRLPLGRTVSSQLAAASVNRVVPAGIGGAAVSVRFLQRSGASVGDAVAAVAGLGAVGAVGDFVFAGTVVSFGPLVGLTGGSHEVALLAARGLRAGQHAPWAVVLLAVVVAAVAIGIRRRHAHRTPSPAADGPAHPVRRLAAQPRRWLLALPASTGTTASVAIAFAWSVRTFADPGAGHAVPSAGALVVLYLVAAAAGSAVPLPAFFGTTEAALVAGLVASGVTLHAAVLSTIVFRLIAFWAPLPVGIVAARRLRAARCL